MRELLRAGADVFLLQPREMCSSETVLMVSLLIAKEADSSLYRGFSGKGWEAIRTSNLNIFQFPSDRHPLNRPKLSEAKRIN